MTEHMHDRLLRRVKEQSIEHAARMFRKAAEDFAAEPDNKNADELATAAALAFRHGVLDRYDFGKALGDIADWACHEKLSA